MDYQKETDARIVIDDLLRKAGWDPADKSMVETEVLVSWPAGAAREATPAPDGTSPSAGRDTFGRADRILFLVDREQLAEPAPEGNPAQLIRETLALEREIVTGLEKLLKEIEEK